MDLTPALGLEHVVLGDGTSITIRPIRQDDGRRLQAFHARLSPDTIYSRYLCPHPVLSAAEAERLTHVDYAHRMAFVATRMDQDEEGIIGVARYEGLRAGPLDTAEPAVVVEDRFQRRGIGTILMRRLAIYAQTQGICIFVAEISAQNYRILNFIRRSGLPLEIHHHRGAMEVRVSTAGLHPL
jgi:GNAT superfamily N-acetyltransferase